MKTNKSTFVFFLLIFVSASAFSESRKYPQEKPPGSDSEVADPGSAHTLKNKAAQWLNTQNEKGFLENRGQMMDMKGNPVPDVLFKTEAANLNFWITKKGITLLTKKWRKESKKEFELTELDREDEKRTGERKKHKFLDWERIDIDLKGAFIVPENIIKEGSWLGQDNFFYPHCQDGIYGVKEYEKITIKNVYPGIDWVFYRKPDGSLKYDFIVHPGADYRQIELLYFSKTPVHINEQGQLELYTNYGNIKENTPVSFYDEQEIKTCFIQNHQKAIEINGDKGYETSISFKPEVFPVGSFPLIIDPQLFWASFYGGTDAEGPMTVKTDDCGNVFVAGYAYSADFPLQDPGTFFQSTFSGAVTQVFIMKFDNVGNRIWSTYYGGSSNQTGNSIAIDGAGNVFVTGHTASNDFPVQPAGTFYQAAKGGGASDRDAFILKFDNAGNRLWATYYGGSAFEEGYSITTDAAGNLFVTGYTASGNFPTQNPFQPANGGAWDAFILKFDNLGNRLWATYYGGSGNEESYAIANDAAGNVWVTGATYSNNFPTLNPFQAANAGTNDAFILKFDNAGNRLWATYYGGGAWDKGYGIAVDAAGNIFVLGVTRSANFPVQNAGTYYDATLGGTSDAFLLKFDNAGTRLWGTYYGGSGLEYYSLLTTDNLAIDPCGNVYISFETGSNMPTLPSCDGGYYDNSFNGGDTNPTDLFIVLFDNTGVELWSTYFGGDGNDFRSAIALDVNGNLFIAGEWSKVSNSNTYPITDPGAGAYYDPTFNGNFDDGFLAKFCSHSCICSSYQGCTVTAVLTVTATAVNPLCNSPCTGTANAFTSGTCSAGTYTFSWSTTPVQTTQTASGLCAGVYTVTVTNAGGSTATATVSIVQPTALTVSATATPQTCIQGGTATTSVSMGAAPFTYQWCNGATTGSVTGLTAGSCTVTVTDANGCANTATVTISPPPTITTTATATPQTCLQGGTATVNVSSGTSPYTFQWCNGATTSSTTGLSAGSCSVTITDANGCTSVNTVTVGLSGNVPSSTVTATPAACGLTNGTANVNATGGTAPYGYQWSTTPVQTAQNATGLAAGNYTVTATDVNGCTTISTVTVSSSSPPVASAASATICSGQSAVITASGGSGYLWYNGTTTSSITVSSAGTYTVIVAIGNCSDTATATVVVNPGPTAGISSDTSIAQGQSVTLIATGGGTYLWSNSAADSIITITPAVTTIYCVTVTNTYNCVDIACTTITVESVDCSTAGELYLPNAFSPNGDGENETFGLYYGNYDCIRSYLLVVYNRWGEKVFESENPALVWDGAYDLKTENTTVFTYFMKASLINGEEVYRKGNVSLLR